MKEDVTEDEVDLRASIVKPLHANFITDLAEKAEETI